MKATIDAQIAIVWTSSEANVVNNASRFKIHPLIDLGIIRHVKTKRNDSVKHAALKHYCCFCVYI